VRGKISWREVVELERCLLSVDWDYFIDTDKENWGSYLESGRSLLDLWYKRYLEAQAAGRDLTESFRLSPGWNVFWRKIRRQFSFARGVRAYVTDSHALSYDIARKHRWGVVCLFDAHADLGYGPGALDFEVNCSNWLGRLLKDGLIQRAHIFYSPYTREKPEHFRSVTGRYNVRFEDFSSQSRTFTVAAVHICRSGAWTPPWLDEKFFRFVRALGIPCAVTDCPERKWDPAHMTLSDQIRYLLA